MFGKGSILTTFPFWILGQIVISLGELRLSGVTLGIPNPSGSFSPNNIYQKYSFLAHLPPNFHYIPFGLTSSLSGLDRLVQPFPTGTPPDPKFTRLVKHLDYRSLAQAGWAFPPSLVKCVHAGLSNNP